MRRQLTAEARKMLTNDDIKQIREEMEYVFVHKNDCSRHCDMVQSQIAETKSNFAVIKFQLKLILGILSAVGTAVLSLVIVQIWG